MREYSPSSTVLGNCWHWGGPKNKAGYGTFKARLAHRVIYEEVFGPIPAGQWIDHICRTRDCVRPSHLRAVDPKVNCLENNDNPAAKNARKTHCKHGHELSGDNVYVFNQWRGSKLKGRACRACRNATAKRGYARRNGRV
jgi:hypothetical protein